MVKTVPQAAIEMTTTPRALNVLVVDDEDLIRWSLCKALKRRGHTVVEAGDGESGLAALATSLLPFDVVLLDYRLPDRQDLSLLADIKRVSPRAVVFIMTAYGDQEMRARAAEGGARAVVDKPFRVAEFVELVETAEQA